MEWWGAAVVALVSGFSGGGVVAFRKQRHDERIGIRQQDTAEDTARDEHWQRIVETQTSALQVLLIPLQEQVDKQGQEINELRTEVRAVRTKYQVAVSHIRDLYAWIARHMPLADPPPPEVPTSLIDDI